MPVRHLIRLILVGLACSRCSLSLHADDWPQWRGPDLNGIGRETGLLKKWPKGGPSQLWQTDSVGVGYSSIAVAGGRIFTLGDIDGVEHALCLDVQNGNTLWAVQPGPLAGQLASRAEQEFRQLDKNKDGQVDEQESLLRFGWDFMKYDRAIPDADLQDLANKRSSALLKQLDANSNGHLEFSEAGSLFRDALERIDQEDKSADAAALAAARATELLRLLDADSNSQLTREEIRRSSLDRHFGRLNQRDPATNMPDEILTPAEIEQGLLKFEPGRDGLISQQELADFYVRSNAAGDGLLSLEELRSAFGGYRNGMGDGPRGTPTVANGRVYVEGGNGDVACLDATTGNTIWHINLSENFGGGKPGWGYSESPLLIGELLIVTPGGKQGTILALDPRTGQKIWQSGGLTEGAHYSTPVPATINGIQQIVQFGNQSVFGVSLQDGRQLWSYKTPANGTANCCSPIVSENLVFAASAYGTGGGLVKITQSGDSQQAEEVYFERKLQCHHGGIVKIGDHMYSCGEGPLTCVEFQTGRIVWQSRSVGKGSLVAADGMLYVLSEGHRVALVEATPEAYREHGTFEIKSHGRPSWAHPVVANGVLYLRDQQSLTAYHLR